MYDTMSSRSSRNVVCCAASALENLMTAFAGLDDLVLAARWPRWLSFRKRLYFGQQLLPLDTSHEAA